MYLACEGGDVCGGEGVCVTAEVVEQLIQAGVMAYDHELACGVWCFGDQLSQRVDLGVIEGGFMPHIYGVGCFVSGEECGEQTLEGLLSACGIGAQDQLRPEVASCHRAAHAWGVAGAARVERALMVG